MALARESGDRAGFLQEACHEDQELRSEVESLLSWETSTSPELIDRPIWEARADFLNSAAVTQFSPGHQIGPYRIEALLGEGGMGVVYRAQDSKLNRTVAIKFLSDDLSDAAARRRFQREAQMASSLNHPHLLTVYDAGELDGRQYLVTEYIDGGTLEDWLGSARRTWRQIVQLLLGIADGLAAAHQAGILHRDIKPGNILVAKNGYAKLADFGLARLAESGSGANVSVDSTRKGVVIGTIAYMSPEQASGRQLDARSDVFSFGIVLYEALVGSRPFGGSTDLEVLQTIIHAEPERLPPALPLELRIAVEKALEKDPADRYQSLRDLVVDLRRAGRQRTEEVAPARSVGRLSKWLPWVAAAGLAAGFLLWEKNRTAAIPQNPLSGATFVRLTDFESPEYDAAISPDGRFVAFVSERDGAPDVFLTQVGTGRFMNLTNGKDALRGSGPVRTVAFSADGSEIIYDSAPAGRTRVIPLTGGPPRPFLNDRTVSVAPSPDGNHLLYHSAGEGDPMFLADRTGANARQIFVDPVAGMHNHYPAWSPDGRWIYFARGSYSVNETDLWRIPPSGGEPQRLTYHQNQVAYPTPIDERTLVYVARAEDGSGPWLWALDVQSKATRRVSLGVEQYLSVAASADGRRIVATVANPTASLWSVPILDRVATEADVRQFPLPTVRAFAPRFAPEAMFYLSSRGTGDGLWRHSGGQAVEIWKASDGPLFASPAVSPDGQKVAVVLKRQHRLRLHILSGGGSEIQPLTEAIEVQGTACWSPDGKWIVTGGTDAAGPGLFKIPVAGGQPVRLARGPATHPVWSPLGNLIVYIGAVVGAHGPLLGMQPDGVPVKLPEIAVYTNGERARFLPDGKRLVYMEGVTRSQDFSVLDLTTMKMRALTRLDNRGETRTFDITPDGKQIVFDRLRDHSDIVLIDLPAAH